MKKKETNFPRVPDSALPERYLAIIDALNETVEIFSSHSEETFNDMMGNGLRPVAEAAELQRIAIYWLMDEKGRLRQKYVWDHGKTVSPNNGLIELPGNPVLVRWFEILKKGECINIRADKAPEDEAAVLSMYKIKSMLFIPIFTHNKFWGVVILEDLVNCRYIDEDCLDLLRSAARLCANAYIRMEMACNADKAYESLERREKLINTLNKMATILLSQSYASFEETMAAGMKYIADIIDLDRVSVWRNFDMPDVLHVSQIYRWDRKSGGTTKPTPGLEDVTYAKLAPRWEKLLSEGGSINSPVRLLPEAAMLQSFGTVSVFIVPVFFYNAFWGFLLFEDRHNERFFDDAVIETMRSAAYLCTNAVLRAEMEREIADANRFNLELINSAPIGLTVIDDNLRVIDCNDAVVKACGAGSKQYYIDHFYDFSAEYQPDGSISKDKAAEYIKRALEGEKLVAEWTHRTIDGETIPSEITLIPIKHKGKYIVLGYQYDLSNTRNLTEAFQEQSELLKIRLEQQELISDISRGFIASGDSETYVKEAIAKLGRYHGVSQILIFRIDNQPGVTNPSYYWSAVGDLPRLVSVDLFRIIKSSFPERLPDCSTMPVISCPDVSASPVEAFTVLLSIDVNAFICAPLYVDGRLWGIMSVEQRYAPRQWTENEKGFVAVTASTIAGVIMRDIYNTRLKEALHKATEASKAKGEFLSNMSHEMRTPLNAIIGMTAIGKNAVDMERKDYALGKIDDASTHLLGVINDVLDMSKIEANMLELSPVEYNFEKMLQKTVAVVTFRVDEKSQKFKIHIDPAIPKSIIGDDQRLTQVITNLLSNAIKFTPEYGSITLNAHLLKEENEIYTIQISVTDTGIGISAEHQALLFRSFQQAEAGTTRKFGGTGLGLAISKAIVEMMGGKIWIQSEAGKGSTFAFTIQAERGAEKAQRLLAPDVGLNNVRILAVDDDPEILDFIRDSIQKFGLSCDIAISGEEALRLVGQNGSYNVYFVDWKMPGIDGITLTSMLKSGVSTPSSSVVIMISAADWNVIEDEAKKVGVNKFLSKPLFPSVITDTINECLGVNQKQTAEVQPDINGLFAGRRILLVEDVEINREIVLALLEPTLLEIDCAENGIHAVRMFSEAPAKYDMIFMDVQMPEMDGYEATRNIRALKFPEAKTIPIIAMTANVFREDIEKCLEAGMNSHLGKPLDFDEVLDKLRSCLP